MEPTEFTSTSISRPSAYPSLGQAWLLLLVLIGWQLGVGLLIGVPAFLIDRAGVRLYGIPEMLVYVLTFVLTIWFAFRQRRSNRLAFRPVKASVFPIVVVGTAALALLLEPVTSIIPMPDWLEKLMEQAFTKDLLITAVLAAPLLEESLLRGIVLDGFLKRYNPVKAIVWSAFLFGVMHLNPVQLAGGFLLGLPLGWLYYRSGSLWPSITLHFVNNGLSSLGFLLSDDSDAMDMGTNTTRIWVDNDGLYVGLLVFCALVVFGCYWLLNRILPAAGSRVNDNWVSR